MLAVMWFRRHWVALLGALTLVPPILKGLNGLLGLGGNADFIISHRQEPGWVGTMLDWLLNPPSWAIIPTIVLGLGFILWDAKKQQVTLPASSAAPRLLNQSSSDTILGIEGLSRSALVEQVELLNRRLRQFRHLENALTDVEQAHIDLNTAKLELMVAIMKNDTDEKEVLKSDVKNADAKLRSLEEARVIRRRSEFNMQFANDIAQIRTELARRIGRPIGSVDDPVRDLLGNGPVTDGTLKALGDHLHEMADRLPD